MQATGPLKQHHVITFGKGAGGLTDDGRINRLPGK